MAWDIALARFLLSLRAKKNTMPVPVRAVAESFSFENILSKEQMDDLGRNAKQYQPGEEVFGCGRGGFAEYAVNHVNTLVHVPDGMSDEEATLIVTAGTAMYGLDVWAA
jgi:Zn-dependent alcohol dehydrogenase